MNFRSLIAVFGIAGAAFYSEMFTLGFLVFPLAGLFLMVNNVERKLNALLADKGIAVSQSEDLFGRD